MTLRSTAKQKGRQWEAWIRDALAISAGVPPSRLNLRGKSAPGCDIWPSQEVRGRLPLAVEAKARARLNPYQAMRQAEGNAYEGLIPLVAAHSRGVRLATVPLEVFLAMVAELAAGGDPHWGMRILKKSQELRGALPPLKDARVDAEEVA